MAVDPVLLDTCVIVAASVTAHPSHAVARGHVTHLVGQGTPLCICPQICREFMVVLTRQPVSGVTFTPEAAIQALDEWRNGCTVLAETPDIVAECLTLVRRHQVRGKQVHDTNLVAVAIVHGIPTLCTRNAADFRRFTEIQIDAL